MNNIWETSDCIMVSVDLEKASDRVQKEEVQRATRKSGTDVWIVSVILAMLC